MQAAMNARLRRGPAHWTAAQLILVFPSAVPSSTGRCAAWDPRPCESRHEAQFWYNRHISQPLIRHLR